MSLSPNNGEASVAPVVAMATVFAPTAATTATSAPTPEPVAPESTTQNTTVVSTSFPDTAEALLARTIGDLHANGVGHFFPRHPTICTVDATAKATTTHDIKHKKMAADYNEEDSTLDYTKSAFYSPAKAVVPRRRPKSRSSSASRVVSSICTVPVKRTEERDDPCDEQEKNLIRALHYSTEVLYSKNHMHYNKKNKEKTAWISNLFRCGDTDVEQFTLTMSNLAERVPSCGPMNHTTRRSEKKEVSSVPVSSE